MLSRSFFDSAPLLSDFRAPDPTEVERGGWSGCEAGVASMTALEEGRRLLVVAVEEAAEREACGVMPRFSVASEVEAGGRE